MVFKTFRKANGFMGDHCKYPVGVLVYENCPYEVNPDIIMNIDSNGFVGSSLTKTADLLRHRDNFYDFMDIIKRKSIRKHYVNDLDFLLGEFYKGKVKSRVLGYYYGKNGNLASGEVPAGNIINIDDNLYTIIENCLRLRLRTWTELIKYAPRFLKNFKMK